MFLFPLSSQSVKKAVRRHGVKSVQPEAIVLIKQILAEEMFRLVHKSIERVDKRGRKLIYLDDFVEALGEDKGFSANTSITIQDWISTGRGMAATQRKKAAKRATTAAGAAGAAAAGDTETATDTVTVTVTAIERESDTMSHLMAELGNLVPMDEVMQEEPVNRRSTLRKRKKTDV